MQLKKQTKCWFSQLNKKMDFEKSIRQEKTSEKSF